MSVLQKGCVCVCVCVCVWCVWVNSYLLINQEHKEVCYLGLDCIGFGMSLASSSLSLLSLSLCFFLLSSLIEKVEDLNQYFHVLCHLRISKYNSG